MIGSVLECSSLSWLHGELLGAEAGRLWLVLSTRHFSWVGGVHSGMGGAFLGSVVVFDEEEMSVAFSPMEEVKFIQDEDRGEAGYGSCKDF